MAKNSGETAVVDTAARLCALDECDLAADGNVTGGRGRFYCSRRHRDAAIARELARPTCPVCRNRFPRPERGRPAVYCGDKCRSARERELDKAAKELAKDNGSGELSEQLARSELLYSTWRYDAGGEDGWQGRNLAERYWPGTVPPRLSEPSPMAVTALVGRINRLRDELREADRKRRQQEAAEQERVIDARLAETRKAQQQEDQAWRRELLDQAGKDTAG